MVRCSNRIFGIDYVLKAKKLNRRSGTEDGDSEEVALYDVDVVDGTAISDKMDGQWSEEEAAMDDLADMEGETSANDTADTEGQTIKTDRVITYYGYVGEDEKDKYPLRLNDAGAVALKFEHTDFLEDMVYWIVKIKNDSGDTVASLKSKGNILALLSGNLGLPAGNYNIEVWAKEDCDELYALSIAYHESRYWEHETNNDRKEEADILQNGVGVNGSVSRKEDIDYYAFTCQESGSYDLILKHETVDAERCGFCIEMFEREGGNNLITESLSDESGAQETYSLELEVGETYYFQVKADGKWNKADYILRVAGK